MREFSVYRRMIAGQCGIWAYPPCAALRLAAAGYGIAIRLRNRVYTNRGPSVRVPVPVISVGNLTVGGTGKTPMVIELITRLTRMGHRPAAVSRGYGSVGARPNDEERLIRAHAPNAVIVSDPDRGRGAQRAFERQGADVIVLDDGFQHRRLHRVLDIVVIDATNPFGYGYLLPRGFLREPCSGLRRAQLVILTRCELVTDRDLLALEMRVRWLAPAAVLLKCRNQVTAIERLDGTPWSGTPAGKKAVLFAAIARPEAFLATVASLGIEVVGTRWWPDHYGYKRIDWLALQRADRFPPNDGFLTTEKDAVKLAGFLSPKTDSLYVVKSRVDFSGEDGMILDTVLKRIGQLE